MTKLSAPSANDLHEGYVDDIYNEETHFSFLNGSHSFPGAEYFNEIMHDNFLHKKKEKLRVLKKSWE